MGGVVSRYVCIPVYFSTFLSFKNILFFTLLFILFIFYKKSGKVDRSTANPCAATVFGCLLFCFSVPFLWTRLPLRPPRNYIIM